MPGVAIKVDVRGLRGIKLGGKEESAILSFDVNAKLEEKERRSGRLIVWFGLTVSTKPSVAKFEVEGIATLEGRNSAIERLLEADPRTRVPVLLHRVYQRVFTSTFLLSTLLETAYPPPDLLHSGVINKPTAPLQSIDAREDSKDKEDQVEASGITVKEKKTKPAKEKKTKPAKEKKTKPKKRR